MNLGELKALFDAVPDHEIMSFGLEDVFSWRGVYAEPCFSIGRNILASHSKQLIQEALSGTFTGWKGGHYKYDESDPVNFEVGSGSYTDGEYFAQKLGEIHQSGDNETMLFWLKVNGAL